MHPLTPHFPFVKKGSLAYRKINLAFFIAGFTIFTVLYCVQPLLPYFVESFHVSATQASAVLAISTLTLAIALLLFGALSETLGRKKMMVFSVISTSLLACILPFITDFHLFLIIRGCIGFCLAGLPAIAIAYLSEEIEKQSVGLAIGLYISGNALGATFGRVFASTVASTYGEHIALLAVAIVSILAAIFFITLLPASKHFEKKPLHIPYLASMYVHHIKNPLLLRYFFLGFLFLGSNIALFNYIGFSLKELNPEIHSSWIGSIYLLFLLGMISSTSVSHIVQKIGVSMTFRFIIALFSFGALLTLLPVSSMKIIGLACSVYAFFSGHSLASSQVSKSATANKAQASSLYLLFYYVGSSVGGIIAGTTWQLFGWKGVVVYVIFNMIVACTLIPKKEGTISV